MNASQPRTLGRLVVLSMMLASSASCISVRKDSVPGSAALTRGAVEPHGYMIANYTIKDPELFKKYMEAAGNLAPKFDGKVIVFDVKARALEGRPKTVMAIAEFPSVSAGMAYLPIPIGGALTSLFVVERFLTRKFFQEPAAATVSQISTE